MDTVYALLGAAVAREPTRPLLTWYDDGTGERTELSGATLANWVAKTANLLVDGLGLGTGERAVVRLPAHWQTAAVLLGCWCAGLTVVADGPAEVGFELAGHQGTSSAAPPTGSAGAHPTGDAYPTGDAAGNGDGGTAVIDRFALRLHPLGLPLAELPAGYQDFIVAVRGHGDRYVPAGPPPDQTALCAAAVDRAQALGIGPHDRVLIDARRHPDPVDWLLAPLAAGASTVLCGHLDPARLAGRTATERVTRVV